MTSERRQLPHDWQWVELGTLFTEDRNQMQAGDEDFDILPFVGLENIESHTRRFVAESPAKAESTCFRFDQEQGDPLRVAFGARCVSDCSVFSSIGFQTGSEVPFSHPRCTLHKWASTV